MEQKKVIREFKVLTEQISPDNVAVMAELIAMRETKALIGYYGYYAEKAHKNLCRDIFGKHEPGYIFSDSYDFVQSVALFLCDHYGEYLDDVLYISKRGKPRTIKTECYLIVTRIWTSVRRRSGLLTRRRDRGILEPYGKHESCARLPHVRLELSRDSETAFQSGKHGIRILRENAREVFRHIRITA